MQSKVKLDVVRDWPTQATESITNFARVDKVGIGWGFLLSMNPLSPIGDVRELMYYIFDTRRPQKYWKSGKFNRDCDSRIFKGLLRASLAGGLYWESRNSNRKASGV